MNRIQALEQCTAEIAKRMVAAGVNWAVGASMMLHYRGLNDDPHDIDMVVQLDHAEAALAVMDAIGIRQPDAEKGVYATKYFVEYKIGDIEADLMAGLIIQTEEGPYRYPFDASRVVWIETGSDRIPLCPLEDWYALYQMMPGKEHRVRQLAEYFAVHSAKASRIRALLAEPLPEAVKASLRGLSLLG